MLNEMQRKPSLVSESRRRPATGILHRAAKRASATTAEAGRKWRWATQGAVLGPILAFLSIYRISRRAALGARQQYRTSQPTNQQLRSERPDIRRIAARVIIEDARFNNAARWRGVARLRRPGDIKSRGIQDSGLQMLSGVMLDICPVDRGEPRRGGVRRGANGARR